MTDTNILVPTDEAIMAWAMSHQTDAIKVLRGSGFVRVARAVLAKWGAPAPAVSEPAVPAGLEPVAWLIERSAFTASPDGQDAEGHEWLEQAHEPGESGSFAVYTAPQVQALLAQGLAPGWQAVPVDLDDEIAEAIAMTANCCGGGAYDIWRAALAAAPSGPAPEPLTDEQIEAAWDGLQARRALKESADFRARIGVPCSRCEGGTYRADHNGYSQFHRCNKCRHVPFWEKDGREFGITAAQKGDHG